MASCALGLKVLISRMDLEVHGCCLEIKAVETLAFQDRHHNDWYF
jgi:hypothetical protein